MGFAQIFFASTSSASVVSNIINSVISRMRPGQHDLGTADGRSRERRRRAALSTSAALLARLIAVATALASVPLTLNYLGGERFGLWMTVSSVIAMLTFADLGIGNGLLNAVAAANGRDDTESIKRYISSAAIILSVIACLILAAFALIYSFVPWAGLFRVTSPLAAAEAAPSAAVFVTCFALSVPMTIVQRVQLGLQLGFIANLWQAGGSVLALIALLLVIYLRLGLPWLVLAMAGTPLLAAALNGLTFFLGFRPDLVPRKRLATYACARQIAASGILFFVLQAVAAVMYSSDNFVIARIMGAAAVTGYAIPDKMYSVIPTVTAIVLLPLWPAYGEAIARKDIDWVRKTLTVTLAVSLLISAGMAVMFFFFGSRIIHLWVRNPVAAPTLLLLGMTCWRVIEAGGNAVAVYLNGCNIIREQAAIAILTAIVAICFKVWMVGRMGAAGAVWSTIAAYTIFTAAPTYVLVRKSLARNHAATMT